MVTGLKYSDKEKNIIGCSLIDQGYSLNEVKILDEYNHEHEINHTELFLSYPLPQEIKNELYDKPFLLFRR